MQISYFCQSQLEMEHEIYHRKEKVYAVDNELPGVVILKEDGKKDQAITNFSDLLNFLYEAKCFNILPPKRLGLDGLVAAKKLFPATPKPIKIKKYKFPKISDRPYSKRLSSPLSQTIKLDILQQVEQQTGARFYNLSLGQLKERATQYEKATFFQHVVIQFRSNLSDAEYTFKKMIDVIDFLCAVDCTNVNP